MLRQKYKQIFSKLEFSRLKGFCFKYAGEFYTGYCFLIYLTLFFIPFQIRKVLLPVWENGYFHETLSLSIYLTDILIILCITCGIFVFWERIKKVWNIKKIGKSPILWAFLFILWQALTIFRAEHIGLALFRIFKLLEMISFGVILYLWIFASEELRSQIFVIKKFLLVISFSGAIQAVWGICQFLCQQSLGLKIFQESVISPSILGVAKIILGGKKYIRAYGGLSHPNILAGFLLLSILCSVGLIFLNMFFDFGVDDKQKIEKSSKLTLVSRSYLTKLTLVLMGIQILG
ncbi:MAG: hypothetical protein V1698_00450, partial [bacterium]